MKQTLLGLVQDILSDMGSDKVNSIGETEESNQVAVIVKHTYFELMSRKDWPHLRKTGQLINSNQSSKPTVMGIPTNSSRIDYVGYSEQRDVLDTVSYRRTPYMYPDEFIAYTNSRNPNNDNVTVVNDGSVYYIYNDQPPSYYTSFDDKNLVFDSYCSELNTTLTSINSQIIYYKEPLWEISDSFVPDLPSEAFPLLYAEAKSACFVELKQMVNSKAEQQAVRQNYVMGQRNWAVKGGVRYPNYGRQSRKFSGGRNFNPNQHT